MGGFLGGFAKGFSQSAGTAIERQHDEELKKEKDRRADLWKIITSDPGQFSDETRKWATTEYEKGIKGEAKKKVGPILQTFQKVRGLLAPKRGGDAAGAQGGPLQPPDISGPTPAGAVPGPPNLPKAELPPAMKQEVYDLATTLERAYPGMGREQALQKAAELTVQKHARSAGGTMNAPAAAPAAAPAPAQAAGQGAGPAPGVAAQPPAGGATATPTFTPKTNGAKAAAAPKPTGILAQRLSAQAVMNDPKASPEAKEQAKKTLDALDAKDAAAKARALKPPAKGERSGSIAQTAKKQYKPGGQSVANPNGNESVEMGAWEYILSGHLPFTGFGGTNKNGKNAREMMLGRAYELLADLSLTPADLPAVRGKLKADSSALSRVTSMGAMVQQFEGTLQRNMKTAQKLSEAWGRGDVQFVNRIAGAFKTGTGDSEALNLAAQLHGVAREWGKIMQGSVSAAGVQVSEANATDVLFSKGISNGQLKSLMENVIVPDIHNRTAAIEEEKSKLLAELRTIGPGRGAQDSDRVKVKNRDGKVGTIPRSQLADAKAQGYSEVK